MLINKENQQTLPESKYLKILWILPSLEIYGGIISVLQYANLLQKMGHRIQLGVLNMNSSNPIMLKENQCPVCSIEELIKQKMEWDVVIATWHETLWYAIRIQAKIYIYYIQSIEDRFYSEKDCLNKVLAKMTYQTDMAMISNSSWADQYIKSNYFPRFEPLILNNGIDHQLFYPGNNEDELMHPFRILVEGPLSVEFKRVKESLEIIKKIKTQKPDIQIWYLGREEPHDLDLSWLDKMFYNVLEGQLREIYSSCDVLLKMSTIESLPLPHIEMMSCGGTVISSKATGVEEICHHGIDSLLVDIDEFQKAEESIIMLYENPQRLKELKQNAIISGKSWPDIQNQIRTLESFLYTMINNAEALEISSNIYKRRHLYFEQYQSIKNGIKDLDYFRTHYSSLKKDFDIIIHSKRFRFINKIADCINRILHLFY